MVVGVWHLHHPSECSCPTSESRKIFVLKFLMFCKSKKLQCSYSIEINKLIQPTVYWVILWLSNLTMGSSNITRDWSRCSGCKACTAKLHHASDITSIVSGWASVGLGLKCESMKLGSKSCCYFPDHMQQDWEIELNNANYIEILSILLKYICIKLTIITFMYGPCFDLILKEMSELK